MCHCAVCLQNPSDNFATVEVNIVPGTERAGISVNTDIGYFPSNAIPLREITAGCFCYAVFHSAQSKK